MDDMGTISRPYAVAAFAQAQEEGKVSEWFDMLSLLTTVCEDATMKGLIASPKVTTDQLQGVILDVCGDLLSPTGQNFARLLAENGRLGVMEGIVRQFTHERDLVEGRQEVTVTSAFKLTKAQIDDISSRVSKRLGADVELTVEIDKSLIGGVVIRAGDLVIDASLRGRLAALRQTIH